MPSGRTAWTGAKWTTLSSLGPASSRWILSSRRRKKQATSSRDWRGSIADGRASSSSVRLWRGVCPAAARTTKSRVSNRAASPCGTWHRRDTSIVKPLKRAGGRRWRFGRNSPPGIFSSIQYWRRILVKEMRRPPLGLALILLLAPAAVISREAETQQAQFDYGPLE